MLGSLRGSLIVGPAALAIIGALGAGLGDARAAPEVVRFSHLTPAQFEQIMAGEANTVVEFRSGDLLPLEILVNGNLLVTESTATAPLKVADTFFLRVDDAEIELSRDGVVFLPFREAISGRLSLSATSSDDGRVGALKLKLQAEFPRD